MKTGYAVLALISLLFFSPCRAALVIEGSRIVYFSDQHEVTLRLLNAGDSPVVVQTWVDDGSPQSSPETAGETPVIPLPSLFRIDAARTYSLRLLATPMGLPDDRESLYWLNLVEVPATPPAPEAQALMKVKVRIQLKLFYRPAALKRRVGSQATAQQFSLERQPGITWLRVINPSPFYISYSRAEVVEESGKAVPVAQMSMLAPFESRRFALTQAAGGKPVLIRYALINDRGEEETHEKSL